MTRHTTIRRSEISTIFMICMGFFIFLLPHAKAQNENAIQITTKETIQRHLERTRESKEKKEAGLALLSDELTAREWTRRFSAEELKNIRISTAIYEAEKKQLITLYEKRILHLEEMADIQTTERYI